MEKNKKVDSVIMGNPGNDTIIPQPEEQFSQDVSKYSLFAVVDAKKRVLSVKSTCFSEPEECDIIFATGSGDEYVHTGIKYGKLTYDDGTHIYFINEDGEIQLQDEKQLAKEIKEIEQAKIDAIDIAKLKEEKVLDSKVKLAAWLADNPLMIDIKGTGTVGMYTVTTEKQDELNKMIKIAESAEELHVQFQPTWNETGKQCEPYTKHELLKLSLAMAEYVYPQVERQRKYEVEIMKLTSAVEIMAIDVDYSNYEPVVPSIPDEPTESPKEEEKEVPVEKPSKDDEKDNTPTEGNEDSGKDETPNESESENKLKDEVKEDNSVDGEVKEDQQVEFESKEDENTQEKVNS